ncbi:hypothetical protein [Lactobacillus mulieris]|uniref:Uncharacterized protein n=1 Tax=Lactobacillus mulieris TaxID=2508708 RepID=A0AAW5WYE4_9LACO|nr:hypothetical protein [Lactobacillus mulieris]MCZ3622055.1 hypothetical protein [Lactobacillus mulieris]MCZ3623752.1 hypothetical protein [Lactobacillus mulieris]MCZ3636062.1 hypothetical protein [Lactobacillus mulieris]MCZ3690007.1 hypothetical protein [Lactobacillus mulieris]MCZ3696186.1 hypothetical protein [Lactobacillus mulieris]
MKFLIKYFSLLSAVLFLGGGLLSSGTKVYAAIESEPTSSVTRLDSKKLESIQNYKEIVKTLNLKSDYLLSAYRIDDRSTGKTIGIINFFDSQNKIYYNFYVDSQRKIEYITAQKENLDNTFNMALYQWTGVDFDTGFIQKIDSNGNFIENFYTDRAKVNKIALGWACLFSSYLACMGASAAASAGGALIGGPWGATVGVIGGAACKVLFQQLVQRFGGKNAACSWTRNLKNTWSTFVK